MFHSLSYFLSCEENRRDELEDSNVFMPINGLEVTLQNGMQREIKLPLLSMIKKPHEVFVFCTSTECSQSLIKRFAAKGCVEIFDIEEFKNRINKRIKSPIYNIKNSELLADNVNYYNHQLLPESRHACPDQIIMSKLLRFTEEKEFRFAFAKNKNAFAVNNVDYFMSNQIPRKRIIGKAKKLILGNLSDIVRVVP